MHNMYVGLKKVCENRFLILFLATMVFEVLDLLFGIRDDGVAAGSPISRTNFSMLVRILESLHQSQRLVH